MTATRRSSFEIGGATPGDSAPTATVRQSRSRQRLDQPEAGRCQDQPGGDRRSNHSDRRKRGTRNRARSIASVGSGGSFGASPLEQHIGLGKSARIVELEIWWPASNTRQRVTGLGKNQSVEITELTRSYIRIERRPITFGGSEEG